jgi:hypothetical protein
MMKPMAPTIPARKHMALLSSHQMRQGTVLIIVVGLSMILLGLSVTFLIRMRSDAAESRSILAEAQARLMLSASLMYLQEASRLGWGEEAYGWTDIRDGSLGPRVARNFKFRTNNAGQSTGTKVDGSIDGPYGAAAPADYNIPVPPWWSPSWPQYRAIPEETDPSQFPPSAQTCFPCPGAVGRFPMAVPVQPPYATQLRYAYNPINWPSTSPDYGQPGWENWWSGDTWASTGGSWWAVDWPLSLLNQVFDPNQGSTGMLDPQPQANLWSDPTYPVSQTTTPDFISGAIQVGATSTDWPHVVDNGTTKTPVQLQVISGTENLCWFRLYRELQADHDGSGTPDYNRVALYDQYNKPLKNWNVFIVACGVGGTRGYRFWDQADISSWESQYNLASGTVSRGQELAVNSPDFAALDETQFHDMLQASKILWYRVEWTPLQGGGIDPANAGWMEYDYPSPPNDGQYWNAGPPFQVLSAAYTQPSGLRNTSPKTYGGNFRFIQRLDHEPPNW